MGGAPLLFPAEESFGAKQLVLHRFPHPSEELAWLAATSYAGLTNRAAISWGDNTSCMRRCNRWVARTQAEKPGTWPLRNGAPLFAHAAESEAYPA